MIHLFHGINLTHESDEINLYFTQLSIKALLCGIVKNMGCSDTNQRILSCRIYAKSIKLRIERRCHTFSN